MFVFRNAVDVEYDVTSARLPSLTRCQTRDKHWTLSGSLVLRMCSTECMIHKVESIASNLDKQPCTQSRFDTVAYCWLNVSTLGCVNYTDPSSSSPNPSANIDCLSQTFALLSLIAMLLLDESCLAPLLSYDAHNIHARNVYEKFYFNGMGV